MKVTRRDFLKLLGAASLGMLLPPTRPDQEYASAPTSARWDASSGSAAAVEKPNVLVVVLDALSARHISQFGYARETMPNLSGLLENAIVFHQHYSAGNFTSPGTASLLTGVLPWTHRALDHNGRVIAPFIGQNLFQAFPDYYRISYTHNSLVNTLFKQFDASLDQFIPREKLFLSSDRLVDWLFKNDADTAGVAWTRAVKKREEGYAYSLYFSELYQHFIKDVTEYRKQFPFGVPVTNNDNYFLLEDVVDYLMLSLPAAPQPFLAYCHWLPPHYPYNTRKDFYQAFRKDGYVPVEKPGHLFSQGHSEADLVRWRRFYDEFILYADAEFGRLFEHLQSSGLLDNTWVVLTSDHGELFERGVFQHTTPLLNEAILRIPLAIWEPGRTARVDIHQKTSAIDVLPTLLQVTGHPPAEWTEGQVLPPFDPQASERPTLAVEAKTTPKNAPITTGSVAYIKDQFKLINYFGYPELGEEGELVELYDLEADPEELVNLAGSQKGIRDEYLDAVKDGLAAANNSFSTKSS
jgi:arylsulfatase A-like enzyme